jgi:hypothetical protein
MAAKQYEQCLGIDESYINALKALAYVELLNHNDKNSRQYMVKLIGQDKDPIQLVAYINAVVEQAYKIPLAGRTAWLNGFLKMLPTNELLNELITETAYSTGTGYNKAFLQAKLAEEKSKFNQPAAH